MTKIIRSPKGRALFAHLYTPSVYDKSNPNAKPTPKNPGKWEVNIVLDQTDPGVRDFLEELEQICEELYQEGGGGEKHPKFMPFAPDIDKDGNETSSVRIVARQKAGWTDDKGEFHPRTLPIVDHNIEPLKLTQEMGHGSLIKISFEPTVYRIGGLARAAFRLRAVQVLKLVTYGTSPANDFEVEEEEFEVVD